MFKRKLLMPLGKAYRQRTFVYNSMTHFSRATLFLFSLIVSACSETESVSVREKEAPVDERNGEESGAETPSVSARWYANGYVMETQKSFDAQGQQTRTARCDWRATERELRCHSMFNDGSPALTTTYSHNTLGRLAIVSESRSGQTVDTLRLDYEDNRLVKRSVQYAIGRGASTTVNTFTWEDDELIAYRQYDGRNPPPEDAVFRELDFDWSDGRINRVEPLAATIDTVFDPLKYVYSYNSEGNLLIKSELSWYSGTQAWRLYEQTIYQLNDDGNIAVITRSNKLGQVVDRQDFTWQKVESVVENPALTLGISRI